MRVSIIDSDPGYEAAMFAGWWGEHSGKCKILINGVDITNICSTADEELGVAFCYKINDEGQKYVEEEFNEVAKEAIFGKVEIIIPRYVGNLS